VSRDSGAAYVVRFTHTFLLGLLLIVGSVLGTADRAHAHLCDDCVLAGAASVPMDIPAGTPLAGYGALSRRAWFPGIFRRFPQAFWFKPSVGTLDTLRARALVVTRDSSRLIWLTADLIAVDRDFTHEILRQLQQAGLGPATLIISPSHTHSGPGAFLKSAVMAFVAVDRENHTVRRALVGSLLEAAKRADASPVEARVGFFSVRASPVVSSRLSEPIDDEVVGLAFTATSGRPIGVVWNFAIHGTMLGPGNLQLSADVMGIASRDVERALGAPALFVNGALGDVSPEKHGYQAMMEAGAELAAAVTRGWRKREPVARPVLTVATTRISLGPPALSLRNCVGSWLPRAVLLPLGSAFPQDAELMAVSLGDVAWVTIPGELETRLGLEIKQTAPRMWRRVFLAGLSNDYLGYFGSADDYDRPGYVSCANLYGANAGDRLALTASGLLRQLAGRTAILSPRRRAVLRAGKATAAARQRSRADLLWTCIPVAIVLFLAARS
jgi:neutral ceramidase